MVFCTSKPSVREASCCSVAVVKGGAGLRRSSSLSTVPTVKRAARMRAAAASAIDPLSSASRSSSAPSISISAAVNVPPPSAMTPASTVQYSRGTKASISASRSHTRRSATDCTRPADRLPGSLRHSTGERWNPTR